MSDHLSKAKLAASRGIVGSVYSEMPSWVVNLTTFVVGVTSLVLVLLYNYQDSMLYFPSVPGLPRKPEENPDRYKNPMDHLRIPYEEKLVETADGFKVATWLMLQKEYVQSSVILVF